LAAEESSQRNETLKAGYICGKTPMTVAMVREKISGVQKCKHTKLICVSVKVIINKRIHYVSRVYFIKS
jgi:hypothetical protein